MLNTFQDSMLNTFQDSMLNTFSDSMLNTFQDSMLNTFSGSLQEPQFQKQESKIFKVLLKSVTSRRILKDFDDLEIMIVPFDVDVQPNEVSGSSQIKHSNLRKFLRSERRQWWAVMRDFKNKGEATFFCF